MKPIVPVALLLMLACAGIWAIEPLQLLQPNALVMPGSQVDYGTVGPGQTFQVRIDYVVKKDGEFVGQWDQATVTELPQGWSAKPGVVYPDMMLVEVSADPGTPDGEYVLPVRIDDDGGREDIGGSFPFSLLVHVRRDLLLMDVEPKKLQVGAGQPARFEVTLTNEGTASDRFEITSENISSWALRKSVYLAGGASKTIVYEVVGNDESNYKMSIDARSASSSLISQTQPVELDVHSDLISDMKATSNGVLLFPSLEMPVYSLAGLLGWPFGR
ncbi:MAG: hypothetical protein V1728_03390 [Candidatus Micrarchaeota archaeon]